MKWTKFVLETTTEAEDLVSAVLNEMGIEGIQIEDKIQLSEEDKQKMFIDILPELPPDDGIAEISFYCDSDIDAEDLKKTVIENLSEYSGDFNLGTLRMTIDETEDKDWINNWKEFFHPFRIDENIVIKPTWSELEDKRNGDMIIEIDPGTAFGSGTHETTKLCILNLKKYMQSGDKILDVGCGSGILAIAGMRLGAQLGVAIDVDDNASRTAAENSIINNIPSCFINIEGLLPGREEAAALNVHIDDSYTYESPAYHMYESVVGEESVGCPCVSVNEKGEYICSPARGTLAFMTGNVIDDSVLRSFIGLNSYELVVANILADIIIPLSSVVGEFMKPGAIFISSGIIASKEQEVVAAVKANGFELVEVTHMNEWVSVVARKPV